MSAKAELLDALSKAVPGDALQVGIVSAGDSVATARTCIVLAISHGDMPIARCFLPDAMARDLIHDLVDALKHIEAYRSEN